MLDDVVIDTCVLMHADNDEDSKRDASRNLIRVLRASATSLCVDEGYDPDEGQNRSAIASEYLEHLIFGSLGFELLTYCAQSGRLRTIPTRVSTVVNRTISQLVPDKTDRKFVKVAVNSHEQVLATHDHHIGRAARGLKARLDVEVLDAEHCRLLLSADQASG